MIRKNYMLVFMCVLCAFIISFFAGCINDGNNTSDEQKEIEDQQIIDRSIDSVSIESNEGSEDLVENTRKLSEFETEACKAADDAGTCDTKLRELGIVSKADCCKYLSKCCQ